MKIRNLLIIGFLFLTLIFLSVYFVNQRLSNAVLTNTTYLNNSEAIIRNSNRIHKEIIGMQSGFRGYLLTSQESFLQPYYNGLGSVPQLIAEQRLLLSRNIQVSRLDSIALLHLEWIEYADSLITAKKDTLPSSVKKYQRLFDSKLKMEVGKNLNDRIQSIFFALDDYEYDIRQQRREALEVSIESTRNISLALTVISSLVVILLSMYVIRVITRRINKMIKLAETISKGDFLTINDQRRDEFQSLVHSLNNMSQTLDVNFKELRTKNQELDQFAYVVSHDLKAPLRGISNIIAWIEEDHEADLTPDIKHNLSLIKGRTERLENMINGILEYARIGKMRKGAEQVNTIKMLNEIKELIVPDRVTFTVSDTIPNVFAERLLLEQVFANLIGNAVKHNPSRDASIVVTGSEKDKFYEFAVSDNGPGIEKVYFDKIFVIFQTLQERDAFESTGVGLAIVKKIIDDHNGTISVESELGKGTTIIFTWPKTQLKQ